MRRLRLLYLSCHGPLEHDELKLFGELGYEWVSLSEKNPINRPRSVTRDGNGLQGCALDMQARFGAAPPGNVPAELLEWADVLIVMHRHEWLKTCIVRCRKPIIWRSIGQAVPEGELHRIRDRFFCVRMSPREAATPQCISADAVIRFHKDPEEFRGWEGKEARALSIFGMPNMRRAIARIDLLEQVLRSGSGKLFGLDTERDLPTIGKGTLQYEQLKAELRSARVFFTIGTFPGPYTLSLIEAMMTGCPVVTIGPGLWASKARHMISLYETAEIVKDAGIVSDNPDVLVASVRRLLSNYEEAKELGAKARARAIELFGKQTALKVWKSILEPVQLRVRG